ncbi:hypothetical protein EDC65_0313 [Stella humosa]|uniref:Uncharacterized protein n=1 Tax=Stella humosa TaxID=94 RepID=A0A3N1MJ84_9PROT|nr:hypothetical protein [Stella humosa]ROQ01136.1 hypothetical protein EDC65_0313 [Stella humosa]BBK31510.1 hypothetical protein STHU_21440 [Stella humosa]
MRQRPLRILVIAWLSMVGVAAADEGNYGFKGAVVGTTTLAEFRRANAFRGGERPYCSDRHPRFSEWFTLEAWEPKVGVIACTMNGPEDVLRKDWRRETIAGVDATPVYYFLDQKLVRIMITFRAEHYGTIAEEIAGKYGPADHTERRTIQNRMGATFGDRRHVWVRKTSSIAMGERGAAGKVDAGRLLMSHRPLSDLLEERRPKRRRDL